MTPRHWLFHELGLFRVENERRAQVAMGPATFRAMVLAMVQDYVKIHAPADPGKAVDVFMLDAGAVFAFTVADVLTKHGLPARGRVLKITEDQVRVWIDAWQGTRDLAPGQLDRDAESMAKELGDGDAQD